MRLRPEPGALRDTLDGRAAKAVLRELREGSIEDLLFAV
jgi:hypothetical protein